jgi:hypothetical protein
MSEIVKVQVPITASEADQMPLVYAKGHRLMVQQPLDLATKRAMGADFKAFFKAEYRPTLRRWSIGTRVKDRDW